MFYIVGLGNPGDKYNNTRHNVGFMLVRDFCDRVGLPNFVKSGSVSGEISEGVVKGTEVSVLLPDTFMNNSGVAVKKLLHGDKADQLIVVYDDVDLPIGEYKLSFGRGDGGHNGIKSIIKELGTKDFVRLRIGIAPRSFWTRKVHRPPAAALSRHVLGKFTKRDISQLETVKKELVEVVTHILEKGLASAMNKYN